MEGNNRTTFLHRVFIKPGHENDYLAIWTRDVAIRQSNGFMIHNAFIETGSGMRYDFATNDYSESEEERVLTWLYSIERNFDIADLDGENESELAREKELLILHPDSIRQVTPKIIESVNEDDLNKMIIMRQYKVKNDWDEFLEIWWRIVQVRQKYGFTCIFAVEDIEEKVFSWAFNYEGDDFEEFMQEGQADYYADPMRIELETINNYLDSIRLTPARQLIISS